jgi:hypothetical protein
MSNTIRIKRRAIGGAIGAPSSLENAELAFNEADDTLYYGKGTGGVGGSATTIEPIGGIGAFVSKNNIDQTIDGEKTFVGTVIAPTQDSTDDSTKVATTAFVKSIGYVPAPTGVVTGTFTKVTINSNGYVTLGSTLSASDIPSLTASKISDFDTQVRLSGLDQMAEPESNVSFNDVRITNLATPVNDNDAANKLYVDTAIQGIKPKNSVKAATTGNITLSATQTIDDISVIDGDRVLVKNQTTSSQNGIYIVSGSAWTRAADMNSWDEVVSAFVFVEEGTTNADTGWLCSANSGGTLDTTAITWVQFSSAGSITAGTGLSKDGNTLNVGAGTGITVGADDVALTGQSLALHNLSTNGLITRTGSGTVTSRTISTSGTGISVADGNGVSANPTISLSTALSTVGTLTPAADRIAYYTSASTASLTALTSFGRSLIDDDNASTARTTLGLGTIATQAASSVAITGGSITNLTTFDGITIDGGTF